MAHRRTLLLMRHAKSSWEVPGQADHDRPLNKRGRAAAPYMAKKLKELGLVPELLLVSTALRAQQTAEAITLESGFKGQVISTKRLYLAEPAAYFDVFTEVPEGTSSVLVVAHNPGIADLVELLCTSRAGRSAVEMCTAGVAHIECQVGEIAHIDSSTPSELKGFYRPPRQGHDG